MRRLARMKYGDGIVRKEQVKFGGYNSTPYAKDGEIYDMRNITTEIYPLICPREKREICTAGEVYAFCGTEYEFSSKSQLKVSYPGNEASGILSPGDIIEILCEKYSENNGVYIVKRAAPGMITVMEEFKTYNDGETQHAQELKIKILRNDADEGETSEEKKEYYITEYTEGIDNTVWSYDEEARYVTHTKRTVQPVYRERTTTVRNKWVYGEETSGSCSIYPNDEDTLKVYMEFSTPMKVTITNPPEGYDELGQTLHAYDYTKNGSNRYCSFIENNLPTDFDGFYATFVWAKAARELIEEKTADGDYYSEGAADVVTRSYNEENEIEETITVSRVIEYFVTETVTVTKFKQEESRREIEYIGAEDKVYYFSGEKFIYDGVYRGDIDGKVKKTAGTGAYLFILTDEGAAVYNIKTGELKKSQYRKIHQYTSGLRNISASGSVLKIELENPCFDDYFSAGEQIRIKVNYTDGSGQICSGQAENVESKSITFTDEIFLGVDPFIINNIEVTHDIPKLRDICAINNRVWGCDEKTIYATAFGKPMAWSEYGTGTAESAWSIEPFESAEEFTACCVADGYPVFFKENKVYKVYGDKPGNFTAQAYDMPGIAMGSERSAKVIKNMLYYLSPAGVMRYSQGVWDNISEEFYKEIKNGVGGGEGNKYYLSAESENGRRIYVYDTAKGIWSIEDEKRAVVFVNWKGRLYMLDEEHNLYGIGGGESIEGIYKKGTEEEFESYIEFADRYCQSPDKKAVSRIILRLELEDGAQAELLINYDSEEENGERVYKLIKKMTGEKMRVFILPVIPRRCDHFRIKIKGKKYILHSLAYEYYEGTELR